MTQGEGEGGGGGGEREREGGRKERPVSKSERYLRCDLYQSPTATPGVFCASLCRVSQVGSGQASECYSMLISGQSGLLYPRWVLDQSLGGIPGEFWSSI